MLSPSTALFESAEAIELAAPGNRTTNRLGRILESWAKKVADFFNENGQTPDPLSQEYTEFTELSKETAKSLEKAVAEGFGDIVTETDEVAVSNLQDNVYVFSGFKSYKELRQVTDLLLDGDQVKPLRQFLADVAKLNNDFNSAYLAAEYNHAVASSQMVRRWQDLTQQPDQFDLEYIAVKDDRTRDEHAALDGIVRPINSSFWDLYLPPNGWNCRCDVRRVRKGTEGTTDSPSPLDGSDLPKMFRANTAKQGVVFPDTHPYYDIQQTEKNRIEQRLKD